MATTQMHVRNMRREIASKYGSYSKMRAANRSQPSAAGGRSALGGASVLMSAGYDDLTSTKPTTLHLVCQRCRLRHLLVCRHRWLRLHLHLICRRRRRQSRSRP